MSKAFVLQHQVRTGVGDTGQHVALFFFVGTQARPLDLVAHLAALQFTEAGAAGAIAAGAGPSVNAALLHGHQQRLVRPGVKLAGFGFGSANEDFWVIVSSHLFIIFSHEILLAPEPVDQA